MLVGVYQAVGCGPYFPALVPASSLPPLLRSSLSPAMSASDAAAAPAIQEQDLSTVSVALPAAPRLQQELPSLPYTSEKTSKASTAVPSISDGKSEVSVEKGGPLWEGYLDDELPEKTHDHFLRNVRFQVFSLYRRLFGIVFITNMAIFIATCVRGDMDANYLGKVAIANIFVAVLMRQDYVINAFFIVATAAPRS